MARDAPRQRTHVPSVLSIISDYFKEVFVSVYFLMHSPLTPEDACRHSLVRHVVMPPGTFLCGTLFAGTHKY